MLLNIAPLPPDAIVLVRAFSTENSCSALVQHQLKCEKSRNLAQRWPTDLQAHWKAADKADFQQSFQKYLSELREGEQVQVVQHVCKVRSVLSQHEGGLAGQVV